MFKAFAVTILGLMACANSSRADDLFSRVPLGSAFSGTKTAGATGPGERTAISEKGSRILSTDHLAELLRDAQLSPKVEDSDLVSLNFKHSKWDFQVGFTLADNNTRIWMVLVLPKLDKDKRFTAEQMGGMLLANRDLRPAIFALADGGKRLELHLSIANEQVSPKSLRGNVQSLASVAENTATLWDNGGTAAPDPRQIDVAARPEAVNPSAAPKKVAPEVSPPTKAPVASNSAPKSEKPAFPASLAGKWVAAISDKEALALQLNAEGAFAIAHLKDGKTSRSSGTATVSGGLLSLNSNDGSKFAGRISKVTESSFEFTPQGDSAGTTMTFKKPK